MALDKKFIINLKGKDFVLFAGLLDLAHEQGLIAIETEILAELSQPEEKAWVVRAIGRFRSENGEAIWSAHGDASPGNSQMRGAELRHAETRAIARMLRVATNVGMTAFEELGPDGETAGGDRSAHDRVQQQGGSQRSPAAAGGQSRTGTRSAPVGDTTGDRRAASGALAAGPAAGEVAPVTHWCSDCGSEIQGVETKKGPVSADTVVTISQTRWNASLCHSCGRRRMEIEQANVPAGQIAA